jgi:hypothetical protein
VGCGIDCQERVRDTGLKLEIGTICIVAVIDVDGGYRVASLSICSDIAFWVEILGSLLYELRMEGLRFVCQGGVICCTGRIGDAL